MPLWGKIDRANNSPLYALSQVGLTANSDNQTALFGNTTANAFSNGVTIGLFGVSPAEIQNPKYKIGSLAVVNAGSGFTARPTVTIGGDGANATATAVGVLVGATIANGGASYVANDVLSVAGGTGTAATIRVTAVDGNGTITNSAIANVGGYTALPTRANNSVSGGTGTGAKFDLVIGLGPITVTAAGFGYTTANVTIGGAGGTGAVANVTLQAFDSKGVTSPGWVFRREGSGNRAGRVQTEVLVAMRSISSDASDDTNFPE